MDVSDFPLHSANSLEIKFCRHTLAVSDLGHEHWAAVEPMSVQQLWSGEAASNERYFSARLLWTDEALHVRFDAAQIEPLVVSDTPNLSEKTIGLWERDVCEIFIAPDALKLEKYFEFEVAPTGEWLDLGIDISGSGRLTNVVYASGMEAFATIGEQSVSMAIKLPWAAFERKPQAGNIWRGNLFRCVGSGVTRGYLSWQPTFTAVPNFHVPERFGHLVFTV